jgi:hypothetical protein
VETGVTAMQVEVRLTWSTGEVAIEHLADLLLANASDAGFPADALVAALDLGEPFRLDAGNGLFVDVERIDQ